MVGDPLFFYIVPKAGRAGGREEVEEVPPTISLSKLLILPLSLVNETLNFKNTLNLHNSFGDINEIGFKKRYLLLFFISNIFH